MRGDCAAALLAFNPAVLCNHPALIDAQLIDMSRRWIQLAFVRNLVLLAVFACGLVTLMRLGRSRP